MRLSWLIAVFLICEISNNNSNAEDLDKVNIRGAPFTVTGDGQTGFIAAFHDTAIHLEDNDDFAHVRTIVSGGGRTYVIVAEGCNGTSCSESYRIIDVTTDRPVSAERDVTGRYSIINGWNVRDDGAIDTTLNKTDGSGTVEVIYKDGILKTIERKYTETLEGSVQPPGGDYAAYALGRKISDVFRLRALQTPLMLWLSYDDYQEARRLALNDFGGVFVKDKYSEMVYASTCQPHDCGSRYLDLAYTPDGRIFGVFKTADGRRLLIGRPSDSILRSFSRQK